MPPDCREYCEASTHCGPLARRRSVDVSGDRKLHTVVPTTKLTSDAEGRVHVTVSADYLVDLDRTGLKLDGGTKGGAIHDAYDFEVEAASAGAFTLPIPAAPGDDPFSPPC